MERERDGREEEILERERDNRERTKYYREEEILERDILETGRDIRERYITERKRESEKGRHTKQCGRELRNFLSLSSRYNWFCFICSTPPNLYSSSILLFPPPSCSSFLQRDRLSVVIEAFRQITHL